MVTGRRFETRMRVMFAKSPSSIHWRLADSLTARLDLIRGYGLAESRRPSCIIMLRRNGLPTTLEGAAKTILGATSMCSQGSAARSPEAFIGCALIGAGCGDRLAW